MDNLTEKLKSFVKERAWEVFHTPKNLAMGLNIEASELLEIFLWKDDNEAENLSPKELEDLKEEIGDIMIYVANLSSKFGIDPVECGLQKLEINRQKYPAKLVKGSAKKYTEYNRKINNPQQCSDPS
jgi:dCTP diphosphatase